MYRFCLYLSVALAVILSASLANADTGVCTGYPKMYNGKPCASTTRYWDGQKGACGCGTSDTNPFSWQWTKPTAAASAPIYGAGTWCGSGCGKCFKLTPTAIGASPVGTGAPSLTPIVVKISNLCPSAGNEEWCAYDVNSHGYDAHFDLMDYNMNGIISEMGWNNPEVTYEEVDCAANGYTDWNCQCASSSTGSSTTPAAATSAPTTAPGKQATKAPTTAPAATKAPTAHAATKAPTTHAATKAPTTHAKPATTNKAPTAAPTSAPVAPTSAPVAPTSAPVAPTSVPVAPTTAPVAPTSAPVAATTAPVALSSDNVKIQMNSGSNNWWMGFSLVNPDVSAISYVEAKDSSASAAWVQLSYQGNSYWNLYSFNPSTQIVLPVSLRITAANGNVVTADNIITSFQANTVDTGVAV